MAGIQITKRMRAVLSKRFNALDVMKMRFGIEVEAGRKFRCPFPDHGSTDESASAVYFEKGNDVRCFAEGRNYSVVDILLASGATEQEVVMLALEVMDEGEVSPSSREDKKSFLDYYRFFQNIAFPSVSAFLNGKSDWKSCWPSLDEYFAKAAM